MMRRRLGSFLDRLLEVLFVLSIVLIAFTWVAVCFDVLSRYFAGRPQAWVTEISEYLLVYIAFLGAAWLLKKEEHVKVDVVLSRLKPGNRALLNSITSILGAMLWLVLTWFTGVKTLEVLQRGLNTPTVLEVPKAALYVVMPIGGILLFIQFLRRAYGYWRNRQEPEEKVSTAL